MTNARHVLRSLTPPAVLAGCRWVADPARRHREAEVRRLRCLPRYQPGTTGLLGTRVDFVDAASFLSAHEAIFERGAYRFVPRQAAPYIVDCGANIGLSVLYFKRAYPDARVLAFEPDRNIFKVLARNCERFGLADVSLRENAVWKERGTLTFHAEGSDGGHLDLSATADAGGAVDVVAVRLRDYLTEPIDLLKIDIEGAEVDVLLDCAGALGAVSNLFVEYHSFVGEEQRVDDLLRVLRAEGFRTHVQSELVSPNPFVARTVSNKKDSRLNIFAFRP